MRIFVCEMVGVWVAGDRVVVYWWRREGGYVGVCVPVRLLSVRARAKSEEGECRVGRAYHDDECEEGKELNAHGETN